MRVSLEPLPTRFELLAALEVLALFTELPVSEQSLAASYGVVATGGLIRREHMHQAAAMLKARGLVSADESGLRPDIRLLGFKGLDRDEAVGALATLLLADTPPIWIVGASDGGTLNRELIPDSDWRALCGVITDPERREELLLGLARRFDDSANRELGSFGEEAVVRECRQRLESLGRADLADQVRRVSLISDDLGYDIVCPTLAGPSWRLEVKTTRRAHPRIIVNISRNEARTGLSDCGWALIAYHATEEQGGNVIGWCQGNLLRNHLPRDLPTKGEWASARLFFDDDALSQGFPDLERGPPQRSSCD